MPRTPKKPAEKAAPVADEILDQFGPATGMTMEEIDAATRRLKVALAVPRDRAGTFEPVLVPKQARVRIGTRALCAARPCIWRWRCCPTAPATSWVFGSSRRKSRSSGDRKALA